MTAFVVTWDVSESFNSLVGSPHSGNARVNSSERAYTVQYLSTSRRYRDKAWDCGAEHIPRLSDDASMGAACGFSTGSPSWGLLNEIDSLK